MSLENEIDWGVKVEIEAPLKYEGKVVAYVAGYAYSWTSSGTLRAVSIDDKEVPDPFLYTPGPGPEDAAIATALWREARSVGVAQSMQDKFDEAVRQSRYGAETEAAMGRVG